MNIFQLNDSDGETMGLLQTNLDSEMIYKEWFDYYNHYETEDLGIDEFADLMKEKHPNFNFQRVFIDEEINPY